MKYSHIQLKQTRLEYKNEKSNLKLVMNGKMEFDAEIVTKIRGIIDRVDEIDLKYDKDFDVHDVESEGYQKIYQSYTSMVQIRNALVWVAGFIVSGGIIWNAADRFM